MSNKKFNLNNLGVPKAKKQASRENSENELDPRITRWNAMFTFFLRKIDAASKQKITTLELSLTPTGFAPISPTELSAYYLYFFESGYAEAITDHVFKKGKIKLQFKLKNADHAYIEQEEIISAPAKYLDVIATWD
jgi:hypothetical protein